jgi:hypothetical protein
MEVYLVVGVIIIIQVYAEFLIGNLILHKNMLLQRYMAIMCLYVKKLTGIIL